MKFTESGREFYKLTRSQKNGSSTPGTMTTKQLVWTSTSTVLDTTTQIRTYGLLVIVNFMIAALTQHSALRCITVSASEHWTQVRCRNTWYYQSSVFAVKNWLFSGIKYVSKYVYVIVLSNASVADVSLYVWFRWLPRHALSSNGSSIRFTDVLYWSAH